jgi:deazaflavin-dependent oxidoreductase (nitroreductase family)
MTSFTRTPSGTRGAHRPSGSGILGRWLNRRMSRRIRKRGGTLMDMNVLFLTTVGARTGERRETPVAWLADGEDAWVIVASAAGSARHPGWYHNIAAHPEEVWIEVGDRSLRVAPEQLEGERREQEWDRFVAAYPRYTKYQKRTDRELPVIRLVAAS